MPQSEVTLIISARNAVARGLSNARQAFARFGRNVSSVATSVGRAFRTVGIAVAAVTAAVGAAVASVIRTYSIQEEAERSLAAALRATGQDADALLPKYRALAAELQNQTAIGDEVILGYQAQLTTLGVLETDMERATQAVIGLTDAGMGQDTAMRAVASAMQGNTEMLTRYIPELRTTKDETERMQIVQEFFNQTFEQSQDKINTTAGKWQQLQNRIGDAKEELGRVIVESTSVGNALDMMSEKVLELTNRFMEWVEGGGINRGVAGFREFASEASRHIQSTISWLRTFTDIFADVFVDPLVAGLTSVGRIWGEIFDAIRNRRMPDLDQMASDWRDGWEVAGNDVVQIWEENQSRLTQIEADRVRDSFEISLAYEQAEAARIQRITDRERAAAEERATAVSDGLEAQIDATESAAGIITEVIEEVPGFGLENMTSGRARQVVRAMQDLADGLRGISFGEIDLPDFSNLEGITSLTSSQARQFVRALEELATGLEGVYFDQYLTLPFEDFDLPSISSGQVRQFIRAMTALQSGLQGLDFQAITIPDFSKLKLPRNLTTSRVNQFNNALRQLIGPGSPIATAGQNLNAGELTGLFEALGNLGDVGQAQITVGFNEGITNTLTSIDTNTKGISNDLEKLLTFK